MKHEDAAVKESGAVDTQEKGATSTETIGSERGDRTTAPKADSTKQHDCLRPGPARDAAMVKHPLVVDEQLFQTPATDWAYGLLKKAIKFRKYGLSFYCSPRSGKTWAIEVLSAMVKRDYKDVVVLCTEAVPHDDPREKGLWGDILSSQDAVTGSTAAEQRIALVNLIAASAQRLHGKFVILFVDEAQCWGASIWRFIKALVNTLRKPPYRLRVCIVSFGQTDLLRVRQEISRIDDRGLSGFLCVRRFAELAVG